MSTLRERFSLDFLLTGGVDEKLAARNKDTVNQYALAGWKTEFQIHSKTGYIFNTRGGALDARHVLNYLEAWCCMDKDTKRKVTSLAPDQRLVNGELVTVGMYFTYEYY